MTRILGLMLAVAGIIALLPLTALYVWWDERSLRRPSVSCNRCGQRDQVISGIRYVHQCFVPEGSA